MSTAGFTGQSCVRTHVGTQQQCHKKLKQAPVSPHLVACYALSSLLHRLPASAQNGNLHQPSADDEQHVQALVREHEGDPRWGSHAQAIVHGNMWKPPGNGGHDDKVSKTLPRLSMQLICKCILGTDSILQMLYQTAKLALSGCNDSALHILSPFLFVALHV